MKRLRELICSYEDVIEELQRDRNSPYHSRSRYGPEGHQSPFKLMDNRMQLETNLYVSNLLRKISLLDEQLRFEKNEKIKLNLRVRES